MLSEEQIKEIAEYLDMGFSCYYHIHTKNILKFPNDEMLEMEDDDDVYAKEREELEENFMEYRYIDKMSSIESFHMMSAFIDSLNDLNEAKEKLIVSITLKKPFRQFKDVLDNYLETKELWYIFRQESLQNWVKQQIRR
jgi:uncharacterized protein YktA (UPF0223 family)